MKVKASAGIRAAAKYVDGPDAVTLLTQPRDVRKRVDIEG